jgi:hypothetical protein
VIIVVEGPSAVGKTTWCRTHFSRVLVEAPTEKIRAPDLYEDPAEVARFWVEFNAGLWQKALQVEKREGLAVCDTDPLHLYFSWSLWKAGALKKELFDAEVPLYRCAVEQSRIGLADIVLWREVPVEELRMRAKLDRTRRRRRHRLYLSLIPWMRAWFAARTRVLLGTVCPWPEPLNPKHFSLVPAAVSRRYDADGFDAMLSALNNGVST